MSSEAEREKKWPPREIISRGSLCMIFFAGLTSAFSSPESSPESSEAFFGNLLYILGVLAFLGATLAKVFRGDFRKQKAATSS